MKTNLLSTKKMVILIFLSFFIPLKILACSVTPVSFCDTSAFFSENLVVTGKIISIDNNGIDLEIIEILKGEETKTTIRIWDGTDFDCNGFWNMAASELGEINDIIIVVLPKITDKQNVWDIIGDYRRPNNFGYTPELKVIDGIANGFIFGNSSLPIEQITFEYDYNDFKNSWINNNDCSGILSTTDFDEKVYRLTNPVQDKLKINTTINNGFTVTIYNLNGNKLTTIYSEFKDLEIDLSAYSIGIYIVHLASENNILKTFKIIKNNTHY